MLRTKLTCHRRVGATQHPRMRLKLEPVLSSPASQPPDNAGGFCQCQVSALACLPAFFFFFPLVLLIHTQSILGGVQVEKRSLYLNLALLSGEKSRGVLRAAACWLCCSCLDALPAVKQGCGDLWGWRMCSYGLQSALHQEKERLGTAGCGAAPAL